MAQFQLTFEALRCAGCGQCLQICPESALQRSGEQVWSSLLTGTSVRLRAGLIRRCARCGIEHGRSGDLCAVCAFRAGNPFGSVMPPGFADLSERSS
jgi:ferredoxin